MTSSGGVLVGIDAGGSYVKATAFDVDAGRSSTSSTPVGAEHPAPGRHERDSERLWLAAAEVVRSALAGIPGASSRVTALMVTAHGNGAYLVDERGLPTYPAVQAADTRAADLVGDWVASGTADRLRPEVWNDLWPGQPGPILAWLAQYEPEVLDRSAALLMCGDYLRARLTGVVAAELTAWSCNGLVDSAAEAVSNDAMRALGVERYGRLVPSFVRHNEIAGVVTPEASELTGVPVGVPVTAGVVDNVALHTGAGVVDGSRIVVGAGTWSINQLLVPSSDMTMDGPLGAVEPTAACLAVPDGMALLIDASATSASTFEWAMERVLRGFQHDAVRTGENIFTLALERVDSRGLRRDAPMFVPYLDGSRGQSSSRGAWVGLSSHHDEVDLARATVEGVCFEHRRHVERLSLATSSPIPLRLAGGASRSSVWSQMFADAMGRPVEVSPVDEQGAVGAVVIGGAAVGLFDSVAAGLSHLNPSWSTYEPDPSIRAHVDERYNSYRRWSDFVEHQS